MLPGVPAYNICYIHSENVDIGSERIDAGSKPLAWQICAAGGAFLYLIFIFIIYVMFYCYASGPTVCMSRVCGDIEHDWALFETSTMAV